MPKYVVKNETSFFGEERTVVRQEATGAEVAGAALGLALAARQKAVERGVLRAKDEFDAAFAKGEYEQALKIANSLATNGNNRDIRGIGEYLKARALRYLGRPEEAIKAATAATQAWEVSSDPDAKIVVNYIQCELGWASLMVGDAPTAIAAFTRAIKIAPEDQEAFNGRGVALRRLGNYDQSLHDLDRAIQIDPGENDHYVQRGLTYLEVGNQARALADFTQATRLAPDWPAGHRALGQVYLDMGAYDKAISSLTQAIVLDPLHDETRRLRANAYRLSGKQIEAEADTSFVAAQARARVAFEAYRQTIETIVNPLYEGYSSGKLTLMKPSELQSIRFYDDTIAVTVLASIAWVIFLILLYNNMSFVAGGAIPVKELLYGATCFGIIPVLLGILALVVYRHQHKWMRIWQNAFKQIASAEASMPGFGTLLAQYIEARNDGRVFGFDEKVYRLFDVGGEAWPYVQGIRNG